MVRSDGHAKLISNSKKNKTRTVSQLLIAAFLSVLYVHCRQVKKESAEFWYQPMLPLLPGVWGLFLALLTSWQIHGTWLLFPCISSSSSSDSDEESLSEGEVAALMEQVEEKKKLITTLRNKPWRMKRRLILLK